MSYKFRDLSVRPRGPSYDPPAPARECPPGLLRISVAILASFVGIRNRRAMEQDLAHLEQNKKRLWLFVVAGFALALLIHAVLYLIVIGLLPEGSSWSLFGRDPLRL